MLGQGHRQKKSSVLLHNYVTHTIRKLSSFPLTPKPRHSSSNSYPIAHYLNCNKFSPWHKIFLAAIHAERELVTYFGTVNDEIWQDVTQHEIYAVENNNTQMIDDLPTPNNTYEH